ncbi:hypothetical protein L7F22_033945 [Adiantum nelumboides]|nr:hypothetical protein [Adiantum nelumboides]
MAEDFVECRTRDSDEIQRQDHGIAVQQGVAFEQCQGKRKASDAEIASEDVVASDVVAPRRNKQRVLLLPSRGVTMRMRHLVNDIEALLPHAKKDSKLDSKSNLHILNELAELNNCNNTLYFEARKAEDLYLWASKTPNGPSAKMHVQNIHTMDELKMTGNCLKGSRPLLSFDKAFDQRPHWALLKEMFTQDSTTNQALHRPRRFLLHRRQQDLVPQLSDHRKGPGCGDRQEGEEGRGAHTRRDWATHGSDPIRIFEGSFGGATVYENPEYISPNAVRHNVRRKKGDEYRDRTAAQHNLKAKRQKLQDERKVDELSRDKVFA